MPTAFIDGITTRYEVLGSGPPLLMCQTEETAPARVLEFLDKARAAAPA